MMKTVDQLLREGVAKEFYCSTNIYNKITENLFHTLNVYGGNGDGFEVKVNGDEEHKKLRWVKNTQLGGYNWELCNMHVSQQDKIAACAFLISQLITVTNLPKHLHFGDYTPPPKPTKDEWLAQIAESGRKERIAEEERREKIKSGKIVLPDTSRPYELWYQVGDIAMRYKTYRSKKALEEGLKYNQPEMPETVVLMAYCSGDHEDTRKFFD